MTGNAMKHGNTLMPHYDTLQKRKNMKIVIISYNECKWNRVPLFLCSSCGILLTLLCFISDPEKRMRGSFGYLGFFTMLGCTVKLGLRLLGYF